MNIGILGDIHGNHVALKSVLDKARALNIDRLLLTGDIVGYYYFVKESLKLLNEWDWVSVRGNHEDMLSKCIRDNDFTKIHSRYGSALSKTVNQITKNQLKMILDLKHPLELTIDQSRILLCHGSPWDNNKYIYPDADIALFEKCADKEYDLVILGHTHYPMHKLINSVLIINPGSVGQSRDNTAEAKWASYNTKSKSISFHSEKYDATEIIESVNKYDPHVKYLSNILKAK
jgi:putative phosphoesterase